jgi:YHS domain-containing protein
LGEKCTSCDETQHYLEEDVTLLLPKHADVVESAGLPRLAHALRTYAKQTKHKRSFDFRCEKFGMGMRSECMLTDCGYYVRSPDQGNCLPVYLRSQDKSLTSELPPNEVALLDGVSLTEVGKATRSAMKRLSMGTLRRLITLGEIEADLHYISNVRVCVVCERAIGPKQASYLDYGGSRYFYCSNACIESHPTYVLKAELFFGVSFPKLLQWVVRKFSSLGAAERALGLTRQQFYHAASLYLSSSLDEHFTALRGLKERRQASLVKRTWHYPHWVSNKVRSFNPMLSRVEARYGNSSIDASDLLRELEELIGPDKAKARKAIFGRSRNKTGDREQYDH